MGPKDMSTFPRPEQAVEMEVSKNGKTVIERLRSGKLPQMVDWFDPGLLAKVGVRSVISATLGSYTDQRLIQAATDIAGEDEFKARYNFSATGNHPDAMAADSNAPVWVDYIADLGDGFEATYAMAYLLAADELKVSGEASPLPAGKLLIMGGDQVYPDATKQEYHTRLRDPYDWAFTTDDPQRKLFAIPGNHDWYDGLSAFSALFCSARDRISGGMGAQIGGWRCHQHRSYFAIKLPHNWWIWGPDIQLADNLDDSQRDYFDVMADQTGPDDNIILCLAEPSWLHKNYDNMHEISMLARKKGAKICAVIAGDWHHYSRYTSDKLGIQFVTCGGGGAFAHATHGLKRRIGLNWATPTGGKRTASPGDTAEFNRIEKAAIAPGGPDFTQNPAGIAARTPGQPAPEPKPITDTEAGPGGMGRRAKAVRKEEIKTAAYECRATAIYPPQWKSRLMCLKNLFLPFRNRPFTYLVGIVYFVYAWSFAAADQRQWPITQKMTASISQAIRANNDEIYNLEQEIKRNRDILIDYTTRLASDPGYQKPIDDLTQKNKGLDASLAEQRKLSAELKKRQADSGGPTLQDRLYDALNSNLGLGATIKAVVAMSLGFILDVGALMRAGEQSPMFAFMLIGLWVGLYAYVESEKWPVKLTIGTAHAAVHILSLLVVSWLANTSGLALRGPLLAYTQGNEYVDNVVRVLWNIIITLFVGGLLGGFVMGLYWTLTSTLLNMHTGDAFGALGIKDYKHFLRIKLEPNRATIYPIALDKVPGRNGWRWQLKPGEARPAHNPHILPVRPLDPHLIEPPIVIDAVKVMD
jgi:hypothetical protein